MSSRYRDFRSLSSSCLAAPDSSCNRRRERSSSPCSRFETCGSPIMGEPSRRNFSSSSLTGYSRHAYPKVSVNKRLLTPLHLDIDPAFQEIRKKEKEEIKTLNNQFAALIGKKYGLPSTQKLAEIQKEITTRVQSLEQHNQVLLTRWNFLKEQDNSLSDLDIKLLYDQYMNRMKFEIRSIDNEKEQLETELDEVLEGMDDVRSKYEEEINKRTGMEFTFTALKKDLDNGFLHKTELEAKLSGLRAWVELMQTIQEQELEELLSQNKDVSIVLGIDNSRYNPDLHKIVEDVRAQYEELAIRSWEELEALTRSKLNEREALSVQYGDHLLHDRRVIAELTMQVQKMRSCIVSLKSQCLRLEGNIKEVGEQGEAALHDAKAKLAKLEEALHSAKQDLAQLIKEYQDLMNIKLALDIEIFTYRKLMEGEEISMESPPSAVISRIYSSTTKLSASNSSTTATLNVASRAQESSANTVSRNGSHVQSGLSRNQSGDSVGNTREDFSRSHSNRSASTAGGSLSRSPRSTNGTFAGSEHTRGSSVSSNIGYGGGSPRSHNSRNGDDPEDNLSRSHSGGIRGISDSNLSRSQSSRSDGLTDSVFLRTHSGASDSVQEGNCSRSQSHRSVGHSPTSISRTQSRGSSSVPRTTHSRDLHSESGSTDSNQGHRGDRGSQSGRSRDSADGSFDRIHSHESEGVSEGSLYGSDSGSSESYVEGGLSRSQSDGNQFHSAAEPVVSRATSAEEGGTPVGGVSQSQSETSRGMSEGDLSRSQSNESECQGSHDQGRYVEPVFRSRSAEDGGVPVGGLSRRQSGISREGSEMNLSRSQSGESEFHHSHVREGYSESIASRTSTAEDGGISGRRQSRASQDISGGRSQSDDNEFHGTDRNAEPLVSRSSLSEESKASVGSTSRSSSMASRNQSAASFSGSQSGAFADTVFTRAHTEGTPEGSFSTQPSDTDASFGEGAVTRSHSDGERGTSRGSIRSATLTDSVFIRSPSSADEAVHEEVASRMQSGTRGSVPEVSFSESLPHRSEGFSTSGLSRLGSGGTRGDPDSQSRHQSSGSKGSLESTFTRSQSKKIRDLTESLFGRSHSSASEGGLSRGQSDDNEGSGDATASRSRSYGSGGFVEPSLSRTHSGDSTGNTESVVSRSNRGGSRGMLEESLSRSGSSQSGGFVTGRLSRGHSNKSTESDGNTRASLASHSETNEVALESSPSRSRATSADSFSRSHSGESGGPVETSTPVCPRRRMGGAGEQSLSRSQSGESGSFIAADASEISRGGSEASLSRCSSKESKPFPEGILARNYSYRCAVISPPQVSRTESSESEEMPEDGLSRSSNSESGNFSCREMYRSQSGDRENVSERGVSRSYSRRSEEALADNTGGKEAFPEIGLQEQENSAANTSVGSRRESGSFVEGNLSRGQSNEASSSPVYLVCEVSSDEDDHSPTGEVGHSVESSITE